MLHKNGSRRWGEGREKDYKEADVRKLGVDADVHYLDYGDGFTSIYIG